MAAVKMQTIQFASELKKKNHNQYLGLFAVNSTHKIMKEILEGTKSCHLKGFNSSKCLLSSKTITVLLYHHVIRMLCNSPSPRSRKKVDSDKTFWGKLSRLCCFSLD